MDREFDFTNDTAYGSYYIDEKSIWKRYFLYKNGVGADDPDSKSYRLQQIYRKLWGDDQPDYMMDGYTHKKTDVIHNALYKRNTYESNVKIRTICADTLNTPTTVLNGILACVGMNSVKKQTIYYLCSGCDDNQLERIIKAYEKDSGILKKRPSLVDSIIEYLKAWHLLGNFMPVPVGFNCGRYLSTMDFFDVTLKLIHDWYWYGDENNTLDTLITCKTQIEKEIAMENTRKWLSSFMVDDKASWHIFVEKNYLEAFVEKKENGEYGNPKEFWTGHFSSKSMPQNIDEYKQFFLNATRWIIERNNDMYDRMIQGGLL